MFWVSIKKEEIKQMKFYTLYLILANVLVFFSPLNNIPSFYLDVSHPLEIWRYFTSSFIHANYSHLISNMFALFIFGLVLEGLVGSWNFLKVYFLSSFIGGIGFILFNGDAVYGVGASAAITGVIGALAVLRPKLILYFYVPMPMIILALIYLTNDILGLFHSTSNIGYGAHIFGFMAGALWGYINRKNYKEYYAKKTELLINEKDLEDWEDKYMTD